MEEITPGIISLASNQYSVGIGAKVHTVTLLDENKIQVDDLMYSFSLVGNGSGAYSLILDGFVFGIVAARDAGAETDKSAEIIVNGIPIEVVVDNQRSLLKKSMLQSQSHVSTKQPIKAPMPGKVVRVEVGVGESVKSGSGLIVLEAMKMENEIRATASGIVEEIWVAAGKAVEKGELLMTIKPK